MYDRDVPFYCRTRSGFVLIYEVYEITHVLLHLVHK